MYFYKFKPNGLFNIQVGQESFNWKLS